MASRPPVECPLCHAEVDGYDALRAHLLDAHTPERLADSVVSRVEEQDERGGETG